MLIAHDMVAVEAAAVGLGAAVVLAEDPLEDSDPLWSGPVPGQVACRRRLLSLPVRVPVLAPVPVRVLVLVLGVVVVAMEPSHGYASSTSSEVRRSSSPLVTVTWVVPQAWHTSSSSLATLLSRPQISHSSVTGR